MSTVAGGGRATIPGLQLIDEYVAGTAQSALLACVDALSWGSELRRRVQHHGYVYDYRRRAVDESARLGPLPDWAELLARRLVGDGLFESRPDQVIANEYLPGQGITAHVDCVPCFGSTVASLSLGSACVMRFQHTQTRRVEDVVLRPGALLVMTGEARYDWSHSIPSRGSDVIDGIRRQRDRRVSLTFRTVLLSEPAPDVPADRASRPSPRRG